MAGAGRWQPVEEELMDSAVLIIFVIAILVVAAIALGVTRRKR
jgi:hypothetical protein